MDRDIEESGGEGAAVRISLVKTQAVKVKLIKL